VLVNGRVVKADHQLVGIDLAAARAEVAATVDYIRSTLGPDAWNEGMTPEIPADEPVTTPSTYTEYDGGIARPQPQSEDSPSTPAGA
jgi:5-methylthioadenosine/S-adenosylhomocysteine deaminase